MEKIETIGRKEMQTLREPINEALKELGEKLGLKFTAGSGSYGGVRGHFKLEMELDDPEALEAEAKKEFEQYCHLFDLEPGDFGAELVINQLRHKIVGLAMNRTKYPIRAEALEGPKKGKIVLYTEDVAAKIKLARLEAQKADADS